MFNMIHQFPILCAANGLRMFPGLHGWRQDNDRFIFQCWGLDELNKLAYGRIPFCLDLLVPLPLIIIHYTVFVSPDQFLVELNDVTCMGTDGVAFQ